MFGFSLTKLVFTVAVVVAVWYGFKWVGRMNEMRERAARDRLREREQGPSATGAQADVEDMVQCAVCGAFVAAKGAQSCGRESCPYGG